MNTPNRETERGNGGHLDEEFGFEAAGRLVLALPLPRAQQRVHLVCDSEVPGSDFRYSTGVSVWLRFRCCASRQAGLPRLRGTAHALHFAYLTAGDRTDEDDAWLEVRRHREERFDQFLRLAPGIRHVPRSAPHVARVHEAQRIARFLAGDVLKGMQRSGMGPEIGPKRPSTSAPW